MRIGNIKSMQYLTLSRQVSLSVIIFVTNWTSPPSVKLSFSLAVLTEVGGGRWPVLSFVIWSNSPKNGGLHIIKSNVLSSTLLNAGESIFISWSHFTTTSNKKKYIMSGLKTKEQNDKRVTSGDDGRVYYHKITPSWFIIHFLQLGNQW